MEQRVLVTDNVHQKGIDLLAQRPGLRVTLSSGLTPEAMKQALAECHALVIRSATKVTADLLRAAPNLRVVGRAGTGLDNVDIEEATRRGVVVMNTPGGNSVAAAEHAIALIMSAHRLIPCACESMKAGKWEKKKFQGREMAGRTIGVIGLGKIGSLVASRAARGLKMTVLGYDPVTTPQTALHLGVRLSSLEEMYRKSDVITVHTPLSNETRGMIDAKAFSLMKDGVVIVNCARGGIIDEDALLAALESGKVGFAALDVYSVTPPGPLPLVMHPNVICTPHLGASTGEAQVNVAVAIAQQIADFLESGVIRNAVNVPTIDAARRSAIEPYLNLARRLAQFSSRLEPEGIAEIEMRYHGEVASWDVKPITNAALVGLLSTFEGTDVNDVNAAVIARDRGIRVSETTKADGLPSGPSLGIRITRSDGGSVSVHGALIGRVGYEPRITGIDTFLTEAVPAGPMLIVTNRDIPGMIAGMSATIAKGGINIAQMNLSRDRAGGMALSILNLDAPADERILEAIQGIEGILSVRQVILDA